MHIRRRQGRPRKRDFSVSRRTSHRSYLARGIEKVLGNETVLDGVEFGEIAVLRSGVVQFKHQHLDSPNLVDFLEITNIKTRLALSSTLSIDGDIFLVRLRELEVLR
ncbi:hypothetical protein LTR40_013960, partial [Exophiala xenobiotica]